MLIILCRNYMIREEVALEYKRVLIGNLEYIVSKYLEEGKDMLELTIYGIGFFLCTLLIQYMLFKFRKNHNHGANGVWVGNRAIMVLCGRHY